VVFIGISIQIKYIQYFMFYVLKRLNKSCLRGTKYFVILFSRLNLKLHLIVCYRELDSTSLGSYRGSVKPPLAP